MSTQLKFFIETNATPDICHGTLWETLKAFLRGQIISFTSHSKRENISKLMELSDNIAQLDAQHATSPTPALQQKQIRLQTEFDLASTAKAEHLLLKARHTVYEFGDKAGRLLAHQARQSYVSRQITQMHTTSGSTVSDHKQINDVFA